MPPMIPHCKGVRPILVPKQVKKIPPISCAQCARLSAGPPQTGAAPRPGACLGYRTPALRITASRKGSPCSIR